MNIDTTQLRKESTNTNAFNLDSIHVDSVNLELGTHYLKHDTLLQDNNSPIITNSEDRWQGLDISIPVSIITFILGFIIAEIIRRWNKSNELKQYKQFIEEWVTKSDSTLGKYITSLEKFSNEIKGNTDLNIPKWETGIIHLSRINSIPLEKYSDIYIFGISNKIKNENRIQLMNFLFQLEYIEKCPSAIMSAYNEYCKQNEKIMDEWNLYYMQLIDLFQMYNNIGSDTFEEEYFHRIIKLFTPLLAEASQGVIITTNKWSDKFISPSMEILSNDECANSPLLLQIIKLIKGLNITIIKHNKLNEFNIIFDEYIESLKSAQSIINKAIQYFRNKKIKRYCK